MTLRIAINGLGRIGRCVVRAVAELNRQDIEIIAVNGSAATRDHVHMLKYDSIHGTFAAIHQTGEETISFGRNEIKVFHERDPLKLPWKDLNIDIVFECTGAFNSVEKASAHIKAGAKKVLVSAPGGDDMPTIVYAVNNSRITAKDDVISIGSCTTNALAPVAKVLNDAIGIENGFMTTIHAYTNDQNLVDGSHKDLRRARAAALSMIPSSTGAAKALGLVLPELAGKLDGVSVRVPTPNVSLVDLTFNAKRDTTVDEIHQAISNAAEGPMKGILGVCDEPLVSIDFSHNPHSSIFDTTGTKVIAKRLCRIAAWYDNEWGFSVRMLDVANLLKAYFNQKTA
ncbi:MAG: gap [Rickettsiales bacterium]|jgi:glyceraldehyde 3-phosphate dehydrogenase|nr:gap [Rickettsiales bacterium]